MSPSLEALVARCLRLRARRLIGPECAGPGSGEKTGTGPAELSGPGSTAGSGSGPSGWARSQGRDERWVTGGGTLAMPSCRAGALNVRLRGLAVRRSVCPVSAPGALAGSPGRGPAGECGLVCVVSGSLVVAWYPVRPAATLSRVNLLPRQRAAWLRLDSISPGAFRSRWSSIRSF